MANYKRSARHVVPARCGWGNTWRPASKPIITKVPVIKCPRCGGILRTKEGKFGKFLGCSRYPKCEFTRSM